MFAKGSRYETVPDLTHTTPQGREVTYKKLRLLPQPQGAFVHTVAQEERLDHIAHLAYRDPEQYWRICDANLAMLPTELQRAGKRLKLPLPR